MPIDAELKDQNEEVKEIETLPNSSVVKGIAELEAIIEDRNKEIARLLKRLARRDAILTLPMKHVVKVLAKPAKKLDCPTCFRTTTAAGMPFAHPGSLFRHFWECKDEKHAKEREKLKAALESWEGFNDSDRGWPAGTFVPPADKDSDSDEGGSSDSDSDESF
ncbi:hypothetical protein HDU90_005253 [Geranomyces variabilis]|nr:hypothetical protein HDU90_005253 [Geranomyces variabilis]